MCSPLDMRIQKMKRIEWCIPNKNILRNHILTSDKQSLDHRLERYKFVYKEFGPSVDMLLVGGIPAMFAIHELKLSYIDGCYMATVLLTQSFIEHSLGSFFLMSGDDKTVKKGFANLINEALSIAQIDNELAKKLHELRKMRNPYTHPNPGITSRSYMGRMKEKATYDPETLAEQDAKLAIQIVVDFLRHGSPDWLPHKINTRENKK